MVYRFNKNLLLENTERKNIKTLVANFGTRQSYTIIDNGQILQENIRITYPESGIKNLTFTATFEDGSRLTTEGILNFKLKRTPPSTIGIKNDSVFATIPFKGYYPNDPTLPGRLDYRIFYHIVNNVPVAKLLKPIVIIDGFDPGDKRQIQDSDPHPSETDDEHVSIEEMMSYGVPPNKVEIIPLLRNLGYDVVVVNHPKYKVNGVDIDGGADYIERNALTHVQLYQELNAELAQNNSQEQLVIVGPSMGGQISRYALAYMEKHNIPHNTRLWVSVDSPHLGANIPVGTQTLLNMLNDYGDSAEAKEFVEDQLGSPAAKQQLIEQHQTIILGSYPFEYQSTTVGQDWLNARTISQGYNEDRGHPFFKRYYDSLYGNGLTESNGYPQHLRKIAIVNGSLTNNKKFDNPFEPGGTDFTYPYADSYSNHGAQVFKMKADAYVIGHITTLESYFMPSVGNNHKIAYFKKKKLGGWNYHDRYITNYNSRGNLDNLPGGWFPTQRDLGAEVAKSDPCDYIEILGITFGKVCANYWFIHNLKHVNSFIPTASSLGLINPNFNWAHRFNRDLFCTEEIPFDTYYGPRNNEQHTSFTQESVAWLLKELDGDEQLPTIYLEPEDMTGPKVICGTDTITYSFGYCDSPPVIQWEISNNLEVVTPIYPVDLNNRSIIVKPVHPTTNGPAYIKAIFASPNDFVQKDIWIGTPRVDLVEDVSVMQTGHTMPYTPINDCDDFGLKLNILPSFANVQAMEWEKVTTNYQWSQDSPGYNDPYVIISPECNGPITFKVRMQNDCGWSDWHQVDYTVSQCLSDCGPGNGGGSGTITSDYFIIYPVPADTTLYVDLIGSDPSDLLIAGETLKIQLFNSVGVLVKNINAIACQNSMDVSNLPSGNYILKIIYNGVPENHQIIIN